MAKLLSIIPYTGDKKLVVFCEGGRVETHSIVCLAMVESPEHEPGYPVCNYATPMIAVDSEIITAEQYAGDSEFEIRDKEGE